MENPSRPAARNPLRTTYHFFRRFLGGGPSRERTGKDAGSYVGLFQGVIETDTPDAGAAAPGTPRRTPARPAARTSGFLRLEVNDQKRATGCFLFFVDGKVLSGNIEGASEQSGFVEASFRLNPTRAVGRAVPRPVVAVGTLHLEARHARGVSAPGEDLTIRFV